MADLPPKLFFRIGEVAGLVGVEPHVLRYWEREFRSIRPTKSAKGQRVYSRRDVENLLRVRDLLYRDGFTIAGAKKKLQRGALDGAAVETSGDLDSEPEAEPLAAESSAVHERLLLSTAETNGGPLPPVATSSPSASELADASVRDKLIALRGEVEEFLLELGAPSATTRRHPRR